MIAYINNNVNKHNKGDEMKWHIDGGHGWLEVSKAKLVKLGIADKISGYSYQKGSKAYLEEDCDAGIFFEAYFNDSEWYKKEELKKEAQAIEEKIYKGDAPLRNYQSYSNKPDFLTRLTNAQKM